MTVYGKPERPLAFRLNEDEGPFEDKNIHRGDLLFVDPDQPGEVNDIVLVQIPPFPQKDVIGNVTFCRFSERPPDSRVLGPVVWIQPQGWSPDDRVRGHCATGENEDDDEHIQVWQALMDRLDETGQGLLHRYDKLRGDDLVEETDRCLRILGKLCLEFEQPGFFEDIYAAVLSDCQVAPGDAARFLARGR